MIDRRILLIAGSFMTVMLGLALWRVSLLSDWTMLPRFDSNGAAQAPVPVRKLFMLPGALILMLLLQAAQRLRSRASEEKLKVWRDRNVFITVAMGFMLLMLEVQVLLRSFPASSFFLPADAMRFFLVVWGLLMIAISNGSPKLPWVQTLFVIPKLDDAAGARYLRIMGYVGVAVGLTVTIAALTVPMNLVLPLLNTAAIGSLLVGFVLQFLLKRKQTH